jgi:hypothetical protein
MIIHDKPLPYTRTFFTLIMLTLKEFTNEFLIDSLVEYMKEYTRLLRESGDDIEVSSCVDVIQSILAELRDREKLAEVIRS